MQFAFRVVLLVAGLWVTAGPSWAEPPAEHNDGRWWQGWLSGLEILELEAGYFPGPADRIDWLGNLTAAYAKTWALSPEWELRLGAELGLYQERGFRTVDAVDLEAGESFLRYRDDRRRLTLGFQRVVWGRVDVLAPTDQISVPDLQRGLIGELSQRRRATLGLRWEEYFDDIKVDALWMPRFRAARLPPERSVWYPINRRSGRVYGLPRLPDLVSLLRASTIDDDTAPDGSGGGGVRLTRDGGGLDWGLTAQRVRTATPYFELDPRLQALLPDDVSLLEVIRARRIRPTFQAVYPWTNLLGGDLAWASGNSSWRLEAAWLSDIAATSQDFAYVTRSGLRWAGAWEHFPERADLRILVQVTGQHLMDNDGLLGSGNFVNVVGDIDSYWVRQTWRLRLRYLVGLDHREWYLNPELTRLLDGRGELYLAAHWFDGRATTLGGLYQDKDLISIGWRRRF